MARGLTRHFCRIAVLAVVLLSSPLTAAAASEDLACNQEPGNRYFWVERAFCDLPAHGPESAQGAVIWNHGISGTSRSWMAPAPPALRLLQARGWDVIMLTDLSRSIDAPLSRGKDSD